MTGPVTCSFGGGVQSTAILVLTALAQQHAQLRAVHAAATTATGPPQQSSAHRAFGAAPTSVRAQPSGVAPVSGPADLRPGHHR